MNNIIILLCRVYLRVLKLIIYTTRVRRRDRTREITVSVARGFTYVIKQIQLDRSQSISPTESASSFFVQIILIYLITIIVIVVAAAAFVYYYIVVAVVGGGRIGFGRATAYAIMISYCTLAVQQ